MKAGDLVKMKPSVQSKLHPRNPKSSPTDQVGLVYSIHARGIKVLMPDSTIKLGLLDHWEIVNPSSES